MRSSSRSEWPFWALLATMFLASAVAWPLVPERFPMHFNLHGQVDHYGTRADAPVPLLLLPVMAIALYLLMLFLPRIDPGRLNYERFATAYWIIRLVVLVHFAILHSTVLLITLGYKVDIGRIALVSMGAMFLVLGSILGKVRPNWFVGVRTPWTLSSKTSWSHSQRAGGWMFIVVGLLTFPSAFLPSPWNVFVVLTATIVGTLALVAYSYLLWRKDPDRVAPSGTTPAEDESAEDQKPT